MKPEKRIVPAKTFPPGAAGNLRGRPQMLLVPRLARRVMHHALI